MESIRVVSGSGTGPTEVAAYDAALAGANVHDYNLVTVSSVVPAGAAVETPGTAPPDLGSTGDRLTVVEASAVATGRAVAALAWGRRPSDGEAPGPGLFYEATAAADATGSAGADAPRREAVVETAREGLAAGADLRDWTLVDRDHRVASAAADDDRYAAAAVLAVYGTGEPIL